jgi:predicted MPP superfamily phosphohydrolase
MKDKYLWYTDTHLDKVAPWTLVSFIRHIVKENPKGVFLTGDISTGPFLCWHLKLMAKFIKCPIYFVLGNHDYHFTSIEKQHKNIRKMCKEYTNLIWVTESDVIDLNHEVCLIGAEGWYDAQLGNPKYLKATLDWFLTKDFKKLSNMSERVEKFRELASESASLLEDKLEKALSQDYKTIYVLTHFPPWKEATRDEGTFLEKYYLPYNVNLKLGQMIERVMKERKKRNVTVLAGHTHTDCWIHVARNIECKVNKAKYYGYVRNEEHIFI